MADSKFAASVMSQPPLTLTKMLWKLVLHFQRDRRLLTVKSGKALPNPNPISAQNAGSVSGSDKRFPRPPWDGVVQHSIEFFFGHICMWCNLISYCFLLRLKAATSNACALSALITENITRKNVQKEKAIFVVISGCGSNSLFRFFRAIGVSSHRSKYHVQHNSEIK